MTGDVHPCGNQPQSQTGRDGRSRLPPVSLDARTAIERRGQATHRLAALGEMTGGIVHDFRNLLAVIESGLRLAEARADEPNHVLTCIAMAREGIARGIDLTSQLLAFAKHQELDAHAGDLNEFLRSFEPLLRYGAGPDIRVRLELGSDIPDCLVDPALFDTAVLNLVVNARDAMPKGGEIRIVTERLVQETAIPDHVGPGTYVCVRVKDQGCGMTEEVLRTAFDPFFTTKGDKGTGIGLSQVRAVMRMIGGHVRIASETGIGTTVDLLFPSIQPEVKASPSND
ncbi:two-component sensor histidine kinase [Mesorhizobium sp. ESP7-2]|uniref:ATP-binding protein n=1 Tax=Mesorhizobium sp. ESP7-2 TaxID=2876622 RepID=UPI001CCE9DE5|nr:ATP-binding protein [Mesorhizobium sp. ESP7-2]MBZ9710411.1 two-component sensor histidine kinase [Mesorhizobium sp. ESP7-2]